LEFQKHQLNQSNFSHTQYYSIPQSHREEEKEEDSFEFQSFELEKDTIIKLDSGEEG